MNIRKRLCVVACSLFLMMGTHLFAFTAPGDTLAQKDTTTVLQFEDDPIASMLDSMSRQRYFDSSFTKANVHRNNKYHFAADSIPQYSDMVYASRLAKLDAKSPFDLQYNSAVKSYIELYAVKKRDLVARIMGLTKLYFPMFEQILDRYNLPLEFKYLAVVESALNPTARSRSGARGLWQFMYSTGKLYNLKINSYVDERNDPYKSTVAACEYFQFLYDTFGNWQLVLAAYNSGPGAVNRAIRRSGGKTNYWELRPYLPRETRGYVPAFIAVNYVMNYAAAHNIYPDEPKMSFFQVDTVTIKHQIAFSQISAALHVPIDEIEYLNPCYKLDVIPKSQDDPYSLCLPAPEIGTFISNENAIYSYVNQDTLTSQKIIAEQSREPVRRIHRVRRGEHLGLLANRYKCTVRDIMRWNNLHSYTIYTGERLVVYVRPHEGRYRHSSYAHEVHTSSNGKYKYYTIRSGDTLWDIARNNGISVNELKRINHIHSSHLKPGMKIKIAING